MYRYITLIGFFALHLMVWSQPRIPEPKPKLVVFLLFDELNSEQLSIIRSKCGNEGFNKIFSGGSSFQNAGYSAGSGFPGRNSSTLYSGCNAATHGIIARTWINRFNGNETDALYGNYSNERIDSVGKAPSNRLMLTSGIGDELHRIHNGRSKLYSVGFNPEILSFSTSKQQDAFYWLDIKTGQITGNTLIKGESQPLWISEFNTKGFATMYIDRMWAPKTDITEYHEWQYFRENQIQQPTFYYPLKDIKAKYPFQRMAGSPFGNTMIRDFVASLIINEQLGKDEITDMLTIQFNTTPSMNKKRLPLNVETEDLLLRLDDEIESLLKLIDKQVGLHNTLIVCTAIKAPSSQTLALDKYNQPSGVFNGNKASSLLNLYLMALHGQGKWVLSQRNGEIYLNNDLIAKSKLDRNTILREACDFMLQVEGVSNAISSADLTSSNTVWPVNKAMLQNFHLKRSGDIIFSLEPGWSEELTNGRIISHSWGYEYVPLSFYGWRIARQSIAQTVDIVDVAPTICSFLEISLPKGNEGKAIDNLLR